MNKRRYILQRAESRYLDHEVCSALDYFIILFSKHNLKKIKFQREQKGHNKAGPASAAPLQGQHSKLL